LKGDQSVGVWASAGEESYLATLNTMFGDSFKFELRNPDAAAYLISHRWGIVCPEIESLALEDKPLIEDCRDVFDFQGNAARPGSFGKFAVCDFTRWFPVPFGAVLIGEQYSDREVWDRFHCLDAGKRNALREALQIHWPLRESYTEIRRANREQYQTLFAILGFSFVELEVIQDQPVFLLQGNEIYTAEMIHERLAKFNITTEFDRQDNLVALPCHCRLKPAFINYIFGTLRGMINPCHTYVRKDPDQS
jgi:hypothetical protein